MKKQLIYFFCLIASPTALYGMQKEHLSKSMPDIDELELADLLQAQCAVSERSTPSGRHVTPPMLIPENDIMITGKKRERSCDEIEDLKTIPPAKCATKMPNVKADALSVQVAALLGRMLESVQIASDGQ